MSPFNKNPDADQKKLMSFPSHKIMLQFAFLFFLLFFNCIFLEIESANLSIVTDKEALMSFKSRILTLEPPNPLSSWDDKNSSPCNWTGVVCNKYGQRVIGLNLSGFGLTGSISPHIGNLSFLRSLQLQKNQFTGTLPDQISNLFRLRVLNMSSNSIAGVLPSNITQLSELQILDLMSNKFTGRIPEDLSRLKKLQVLKLGSNNLYGVIPTTIGNISSLTHINLCTNTLSGMIPSELGHFQNLKELDLTINNLAGTVPSSIYNITSLVSLVLASNQLWGDIPSDVGVRLPNLLVFNFCFNKFTGKIPGSLHNLTNIKVIRMEHNLLEGTVPPGLGNLPFLQMYNIGFNRIVSEGEDEDGLSFITSLKNSTRLNLLAIDGNHLKGVIPESIGNLSKVLSKLYMGGNRIYGSIPTSISHLTGLTLLNLSYNSISGEIPPEIGQLVDLQMLGLAGNLISGSIPNSLGNLQKLNQIDLSRNHLVGEIPTTFGNFDSLLSMDLSNNRFNGSIPKEILNLHSLSSVLNLSKNFLSGPLPKEIGLLQSLVTIDLSDNRLSGNIPSSIKNFKSLQMLFMARNILSGPIPNSLGEVKGLETLDLSSNQLSGSIPAELQNLQVLQSLNLSFNNLEGVVPSGGIFRNLSSVYLEGNPQLCLHLACISSSGHRERVIYIITGILVTVAGCFVLAWLFYVRKTKSKVTKTSEGIKVQHQMVSYDELRRATGNFNQENLIGNGSFGSVYKGYLTQGITVAVKVLSTQRTGSWKSFLAECEALRNLRHRNLVKLITSCSSIDFKNMEFLALVYEFLSNGSLDDWVKGKKKHANGDGLNILERLNVVIDVSCALDYMHHDSEVPVVHCDLKPNNILLSEDMTAKVGDFGLARLLLERTTIQSSISSTHVLKGSIGYIPPEYELGEKPSTAGDVYSFRVMLLELFTGKNPTHESFKGGVSLTRWVQSAFHANVTKVVDPELLLQMDDLHHNDQPISLDKQHDCLTTILGVGLSCTVDYPDGRISITEVLRRLKIARDTLLKPVHTPNSLK